MPRRGSAFKATDGTSALLWIKAQTPDTECEARRVIAFRDLSDRSSKFQSPNAKQTPIIQTQRNEASPVLLCRLKL